MDRHHTHLPHLPRLVLPGIPYDITQHGNYRQMTCFRAEDDRIYLQLLKDSARHHGVAILGDGLMPNHVHLVAVPQRPDSFARTFRRVHAQDARAIHMRLRHVGHLWQARYGSSPMDEKHLWAAMLYEEQNPLRARLVEQAGAWRWSSAQAHLKGEDAGLLDLVPWRARHTPETWKLCLDKGLREAALIRRIRDATQRGHPLGDEAFVKRVREEQKAQPLAESPEALIKHEMAAT